MHLADGPVFITNLAALLETVSSILHELDRDKAQPVINEIDRASSLLSVAHEACLSTVAAIEAGPDYR